MNDTMQSMERAHRRKKIIIISISSLVVIGLVIGGYFWWRQHRIKRYTAEDVFNILIERDPVTPTQDEIEAFNGALQADEQSQAIPATPEQQQSFSALVEAFNRPPVVEAE